MSAKRQSLRSNFDYFNGVLRNSMRYISVECEYFSAKFVPNPALLPELFLSKAMSFHNEMGSLMLPPHR